jgi:trimeric autotransporter adhesin
MAESLEPRRLLAAIEAGILAARGTNGADTFALRRTGADDVIVTTNGVNQQFDMDDFTAVRFEGFAGNDRFELIDAMISPQQRRVTVHGGSGNDTLSYAARTADMTIRYDTMHSETFLPTSAGPFGLQTEDFFAIETIISGSGGDRLLYGRSGTDEDPPVEVRIEGRGGNDTFFDQIGDAPLGDLAGVTLLGGDGNDTFGRYLGLEVLFGGAGDDTFHNGSLNDVHRAGELDGGDGIDEIIFGSSEPIRPLDLRAYVGVENATAWRGTIIGTDGPNRLTLGFDGTIQGGGGNDTITGSQGPNGLFGEGGNDSIVGLEGDDTLDGGAGIDTLEGGIGNDVLLNGEVTPPPGSIRIIDRVLTADGTWGGEDISIERVGGDDVIVRIDNLARQFDMDDFDGVLLRGNNGYDRIEVKGSIVAGALVRKVTLDGGNGNDELFGSAGDDVLRGGAGGDRLTGFAGNDALFGGIDPDDLNPGPGLDFNDAGDGNDFIMAVDFAAGDTVLGGAGTDEARVDAGDNASGVERLFG